MTTFTPISALIGGAIIGLATTLLMLLNGRIAGISGIVGAVTDRMTHPASPASASDTGWQGLFVIGLVAGAALHRLMAVTPPPVQITESVLLLVAGGMLLWRGLDARRAAQA